MIRRLKLHRHMPTREIQPSAGKGTYDRQNAKAELDEFLAEYEEEQRELVERNQFGGDSGIDADFQG